MKSKKVLFREVWFMDGPYRVDLDCTQDDQMRLRFIEERHGTESIHKELVVDADAALRDALSVAGRILHECGNRKWQDDDVESLAITYAFARSELRHLERSE